MSKELTIPIPARLKNVAKNGHVAGTEDIYDDELAKEQNIINQETVGNSASSHKNRIAALDEIHSINVDDEEHAITTDPEDIVSGSGRIPTSNAVAGAIEESYTFISGEKVAEISLDIEIDETKRGVPKTSTVANTYGSYTEDPEFVRVILDNEGKIIEAVRVDGTKLLPAGVEIHEKIGFEGNETTIVESPEFVEVRLDSAGHILWGIQKDGNVYFGAGVPQQVISYIEDRIKDLSLEEYENIVDFLNGLEEGDKTLQELLDEKVNKEEGKSLINAEYAEGVHYIESPEFAEIKLDAEERIVEATYKDGTKLLPAGVRVNGVAEYDGAAVDTISSPEFAAVWLDGSDRILLGIKNDADILFGYGVPSQIKAYIDEEIGKFSPESVQEILDFIGEYLGSTTLQELLDKKVDGEYIESPEYIEAKLDSEDKIVEATREDGTKVLPAGIETSKVNLEGTTIENKANPEYIEAKVDAGDRLIEGTRTDGTKVIGGNLEVGGDMRIDGEVNFTNGMPQEIIDYVAANTGSGVSNIEYEDETGDMYATYDEADGVTDVYMEENGDIYAEIEE